MQNPEEIFNKVLETIGETRKGKEGQYGEISKKTLEQLTEPNLTEDYVRTANKQLTQMYKHIVVSYGFEDFYSLYLYSKSYKDLVSKEGTGKKDFSKLNKVRRTVVRNGRRTTMTFYEKPQETKVPKVKQSKDNKSGAPTLSGIDAKELKIIPSGELEEPITTKDLSLVKDLTKNMVQEGELDNVVRVKMYVDEQIVPRAFQGIGVEGDYLVTYFIAKNELVSGLYQRVFFETIKVAMNAGLGVKMEKDDSDIQQVLAETSGFKGEDNFYTVEAKELEELFGRLP